MVHSKGIIEVLDGNADTYELLDSLRGLQDGLYGFIVFDKQKNRALNRLKYLFGYLLKTLSEQLPGNPSTEALYRYFEEIYAPIRHCNIPGEAEEYTYSDLKSEPAIEMDYVIEKIIHHAKTEWNIDLLDRNEIKSPEAAEAWVGAYADTWTNFSRKI